jgi:hypothetical protein
VAYVQAFREVLFTSSRCSPSEGFETFGPGSGHAANGDGSPAGQPSRRGEGA